MMKGFLSFEISLTTLIPYKQCSKEKICDGRNGSWAPFDSPLCNVTQEFSYVKIWLSPFCLWDTALGEIQYEIGFQ